MTTTHAGHFAQGAQELWITNGKQRPLSKNSVGQYKYDLKKAFCNVFMHNRKLTTIKNEKKECFLRSHS